MRFIDRRALREKQALARKLRQDSTPEEKILWRHLRNHEMENLHFRRQHVIAGFIVDFYCSGVHLIVELDGKHHAEQVEADEQRDAVLRGMGNTVLRFANEMVRNDLCSVLASIRQAATGCDERNHQAFPLPQRSPSPCNGEGTGERRGRGTGGWG